MKTALLIMDMIKKLDFPEGKQLFKQALPVAKQILKVKNRCKKKKIPVIYVNDNYGQWRSSWHEVFDACSNEISHILRPEDDDYFVLKPQYSGFYSTNLEVLLHELKIKKLIITGMAGNICILYTANDAYMRGFDVHVPGNCVVSNSKADNNYALEQLQQVQKIRTARL